MLEWVLIGDKLLTPLGETFEKALCELSDTNDFNITYKYIEYGRLFGRFYHTLSPHHP